MNKRDKAIMDDLYRFRVMRRDDIISLHFKNVKYKVDACNRVMKRLTRDKRAIAITHNNQYMYMSVDNPIKKDSMKIPHFLRIVDFYLDCLEHKKPVSFIVEPKVGFKGTVEPDIFMIWKDAPFFVEIQRSEYSQRVFADKINRYDQYYYDGSWSDESWQPSTPLFPHLWIVSETNYTVDRKPYTVLQSSSVADLFTVVR